MFAALKVLYREAERPSISVAYGLFLCPYASFLIWRYLTPRAYIVMVYASLFYKDFKQRVSVRVPLSFIRTNA